MIGSHGSQSRRLFSGVKTAQNDKECGTVRRKVYTTLRSYAGEVFASLWAAASLCRSTCSPVSVRQADRKTNRAARGTRKLTGLTFVDLLDCGDDESAEWTSLQSGINIRILACFLVRASEQPTRLVVLDAVGDLVCGKANVDPRQEAAAANGSARAQEIVHLQDKETMMVKTV